MTCEDSQDVIFSLESTAGNSPCRSPGGKGRSGPAPARASRSASPARAPGKRTPDTSGPSSDASLRSVDLQHSLESRLLAQVDVYGSLEFVLIWKAQAMPLGRQICQLLARARRTKDSDYSLWPTPKASDANGKRKPDGKRGMGLNDVASWPTPDASAMNDGESLESFERRRTRLKQDYANGNGAGRPLAIAAQMAGWVSPTAQDGERGSAPPRAHDTGVPLSQQVAGLATPRVTTNGGHGNPERAADGKARLEDQVRGWPTPLSTDGSKAPTNYGAGNPTLVGLVTGKGVAKPPAQTEKRGALAPAFSRWLMGFPAGWENYADSATPSSRK